MLNDLKIRNGHMTPDFDSKIFEYDVRVSDVLSLIMDYDTNVGNTVTIYGNENLGNGKSNVFVECFDGSNVTTYTLKVINDQTKNVSNMIDTKELVEVDKPNIITDNITPIMGFVTVLTIILLYSIIFRK